MFLEAYEEHNKEFEQLIGKGLSYRTLQKYKTIKAYVAEFLKYQYATNDIEINRIDFQLIKNFEIYLKTVKDCCHNTAIDYLKKIKIKKKDIDLETILVLNAMYLNKNSTLPELAQTPFINEYQLKRILEELQELEFIETTGKTSGLKYLIHKSKLADFKDEVLYLKHKKQEKARQEQAILRYLDEFNGDR